MYGGDPPDGFAVSRIDCPSSRLGDPGVMSPATNAGSLESDVGAGGGRASPEEEGEGPTTREASFGIERLRLEELAAELTAEIVAVEEGLALPDEDPGAATSPTGASMAALAMMMNATTRSRMARLHGDRGCAFISLPDAETEGVSGQLFQESVHDPAQRPCAL